MKYRVSSLNIFPVKSLAGIAVESAFAGERGFLYDRRWMVTDDGNKFITQRELPQMSQVGVEILPDGIVIFDRKAKDDKVKVPFDAQKETVKVQVWSDICIAEKYVSPAISDWLSAKLNVKCSLVYSPDTMKRKVDTRYSPLNIDTGFSDGFPYLLANAASLKDLNEKTGQEFEMIRFRPNIVFEGAEPFQEDKWKKIRIGEVVFHVVKPCSRCVMITIDPETGEKGTEPLKTLASYRKQDNKIYFAQNMVAENEGVIKKGDFVEVLEMKP